MAKRSKKSLRIEIDGKRRFINVPSGRALDLHNYLRSNRVSSSPPQPSFTDFDSIEMGKYIDVVAVQTLLDAWL